MVSERQLAANRRNAAHSTGPRTPDGKVRSGRNATRHGLYARSPVIPRLEDPAAWDAHLAATIATLQPVGPLEHTLAERAALVLWRLGRVAHYEQEITTLGRERATDDLRAAEAGDEAAPDDPRPGLVAARARYRALHRFVALPPETPVTGRFAWAVIESILLLVPAFDFAALSVPDVIPDDAYVDLFPDWTVERLRRMVHAIETGSGHAPGSLLTPALVNARRAYATSTVAVRHVDRRAHQLRRERILPAPDQLNRVIRYESHLTHQLDQTIRHLRQLQNNRPVYSSPIPVFRDPTAPETFDPTDPDAQPETSPR